MKDFYIERKNPKEEFNKLLNVKDPGRYILRINDKYKNCMTAIFWNILIKYFNSVRFVVLPEDVMYEYEDIFSYWKE